MADGLLPRTRHIDRVQRQGDFDELAGGFDRVVGNGLNSLGAGEQCFDVVVDGGHAPAGFFLKRMCHVVRTVDGVVFADKHDGKVVLTALVPALKDFVLGHRDGGRALDAAFDFDVAGLG